jgi:PASTA domain
MVSSASTRDTPTAASVTAVGGLLGQLVVTADAAGYQQLLGCVAWSDVGCEPSGRRRRRMLRLVGSLPQAGDTSMRVTSGRASTAAMLLVGLSVLAVAGRLLPAPPSAQRPATTAPTSAPAIRTAPGNTRGYAVPDVLGRTLAQAKRVLRTAGLHGSAHERDPHGRGRTAVVVAQEPPGWALVPPGSTVELRTMTDVQPYGAPRQLRLGPGPTTAAYRIVTPDPATHQLTVALVAPRAADVEVRLETSSGSRLPVLASTRDTRWCRPSQGKIRCEVRLDVPQGVWTASIAKRSALPVAIEVTVTSTPV